MPATPTRPTRQPITPPTGRVGPFIQALAAKHGIVYEETQTDRTADTYLRLSDGGESETDATEHLLLALYRAGVITDQEELDLHDAYIRNDLGLT